MDEDRRRHPKLQTKLGGIFAALAVILVALALIALYIGARDRIRQSVRRRLHDIVAIAAQRIDGDLHATLTDPEQERSAAYLQIKQTLQEIRDIGSDLYFVYTMRVNEAGDIWFVVDAEEDPDEISHLGDVYDDASELLRASIVTLDQPIVEESFYTDQWGTWLTGYAPIYDSGGRRVGVLGIDINAEQVRAYERELLIRALIVLGGIFPFAVLIGWLIGRRIAAPLAQLTEAATALAAGDRMRSIPASQRNDELGILARSFGRMAERIQMLIRELEQRVQMRTDDLAQRSRYLETSAEIGRAATSILDTDELMDAVVEMIRVQFDLYYVGLFLLDETGEWAAARAASGAGGRAMLERGFRIPVSKGMIGWCIRHAQARIAGVAEQDEVRVTVEELAGARSEAALPLRSRGEVIGALSVASDQPEAFDADLITVLQTMADQVAVALDNAQLYQASQAALEAQRRAYGEAGRETWQQLMRTRQHQGYRCDQLGLSPVRGDWRPEMRQAIVSGNIIKVQKPAESAESENIVAVPIRVHDQILGVLRFRKEEGEWFDEEISLLETLTDRLSAALESARLYEDTQRRAAREQIVSEITGRMRETLDLETVLKTAADEMRQALELPEVSVRLMQLDE
ncbi:MAG: GAF domain-containing protein [Anaerolineales bacterium]